MCLENLEIKYNTSVFRVLFFIRLLLVWVFTMCAALLRITKINPVGIYLSKVNNGNTKTMCEICSKLTIKTPEQRQ